MAQIPQADPGKVCPFNGKDTSKVCHKCPMWIQVRGTNPQGGEVDHWNCSLAWMPMLMIENSQQQRQTAAAVESFRNVVAEGNRQTAATLASAIAATANMAVQIRDGSQARVIESPKGEG